MNTRARILILGQDVNTIDYADPALPPGMNAEAVAAGLERARISLETQGFAVDMLQVQPSPVTAEVEIVTHLNKSANREVYDVVVIGAGIRNPPPSLALFEAVLNAVHRHAPTARIAFNTRPDDSDLAATRWVAR